MMPFRHRLFWKIYATLLSSLVAVAVLMGALWWLLGETPQERWGTLQSRLNHALTPLPAGDAVDEEASLRKLGDQIDADLSLYDSDGRLVAARGRPVLLARRGDAFDPPHGDAVGPPRRPRRHG